MTPRSRCLSTGSPEKRLQQASWQHQPSPWRSSGDLDEPSASTRRPRLHARIVSSRRSVASARGLDMPWTNAPVSVLHRSMRGGIGHARSTCASVVCCVVTLPTIARPKNRAAKTVVKAHTIDSSTGKSRVVRRNLQRTLRQKHHSAVMEATPHRCCCGSSR